MTREAARAGNDGMSKVERRPGGGLSLADEFFHVRLVAKGFDDVGFPVDGAVLKIGGIERRLLVHVLGELLAQAGEGDGGSVGGDDLGEEVVLHGRGRDEERLELLGGVVTNGACALHHEFRLLDDLGACVVNKEGVGDPGDDGETDGNEGNDDKVEFEKQLQCVSCRWEKNYAIRSMTRRVRSSRAAVPSQKRCKEVKMA